jgi:hypothetical protein
MLKQLLTRVCPALKDTDRSAPQYTAQFGRTIADFRTDKNAVNALAVFLRSANGRSFWSALVNARPKGRGASNKDLSAEELCGQVTGYEAALSLIHAMSFQEVAQKSLPETWEPADATNDDEQ